jgi:DNA-binding MurR/RpiR family transcriptional regulator
VAPLPDWESLPVLEPIVVPGGLHAGRTGPEPRLSAKQHALVSYIEHYPKFAAFNTASELAQRVGVHPATVVRLAQALGYRGFPEFQEAVRHRYLASLDAVSIMHAHAEERHGDVVLASFDQDIRNLVATRSGLDREALRAVAAAILAAPAALIVGVGSHAGLAIIFAHLCQFMGLSVESEVRGGLSLGARLARLGPGNVVIGTGSWWVIEEIRTALALAHERGATTVAVVDNLASGLARTADYVLIGRTESASFFQSMSGPLAALNALVTEIAAVGGDVLHERMAVSTHMYEGLGIPRHREEISLLAGADGRQPIPATTPDIRGEND